MASNHTTEGLCSHAGSNVFQRSPFLALPDHIRKEVYLYVHFRQIHSFEMANRASSEPFSARHLFHGALTTPLPAALLGTCRKVRGEVLTLVSKQLVLFDWPEPPVTRFLALRSDTLAAITTLRVTFGSRSQFRATDRLEKSFTSFCSLFPNFVDPTNLHLFLDINVRAGEIDLVSQAFQPRVRGLKACGIAFDCSHTANHPTAKEHATRIAKTLVISATATEHGPIRCFPFMSLPGELRSLVLQHTNLKSTNVPDPPCHGVRIRSGQVSLRKKTCCQYCSSCHFTCFCSHLQPRGAARSTTCQCPQFPVGIFRASRALRKLGQEVFFRENCLVLQGSPRANKQWLQAHGNALQQLRCLDIQVTTCEVGLCSRNSGCRFFICHSDTAHPGLEECVREETRRQFRDLLRLLRERIQLRHLTLTVGEPSHALRLGGSESRLSARAISWIHIPSSGPFAPAPRQRVVLAPEENDPAMLLMQAMRQESMQIVKRFFVFMPSLDGAYETHMERTLMGDAYNSAELGKVPANVRDPNFPYDWPAGTQVGQEATT